MNNFEFYNPTKLFFGKGEISKIGNEIKKYNVTKVLLIYGKASIFNNRVYDQVSASLIKSGVEFIECGGVKPNPVLSKVHEVIELCRKENVDGILAVGGGSVLDSAKAIAAGFFYEGDVWDAFEGKVQLSKTLPLFTILTLSATGSEMNAWAVITNEDENKKWAFSAGESSYPKVTVLDPTAQFSLPRAQTVNGAVDAMAHIFELYFDPTKNTDVQDEIAEGLLRTIIKHTPVLLTKPDNENSRAQIAWSATLALNGLNGAGRSGGDWATHTLEHSLSAFYDIAHGAGLAIMFPAWMKYVYKKDIAKFVRLAEKVFGITAGSDDEKAIKGIDAVKNFFKEIGAPTSLKEINVDETDLDKLADNAALRAPEGRLLKLYRADIYNIYKLAL
ncbi:MAG: iron-containing alcohol dehydrogenase [bacterium]